MSVKEKFLDYVSYDTQSDSSSTTMPSTMKQKLLAQHLADEMVAMGIEDAHMDEWGYVYGTIPANCEKKNVVGFIAHMDTAEEVSGANVKAQREMPGLYCIGPGADGLGLQRRQRPVLVLSLIHI